MTENAQLTEHSNSADHSNSLFRHGARPEWGMAVLAWERAGKRAYQFEDGKLRIFKEGWWDQLEEIDEFDNRMAATLARLQRKLGLEASDQKRPVAAKSALRWNDQVRLLEDAYPGGLQGTAWQEKVRGAGNKRRLKRHRDASIAEARQRLSDEALGALLDAGEASKAWNEIVAVLRSTDLVGSRNLKDLDAIGPEHHELMVRRVRDLLWSDESYAIRFERFVGALARCGSDPTWQLATALPALVHPESHVCIKPSIFRTQASQLAPNLRYSQHPDAGVYRQLSSMADRVRQSLADAGQEPRDLMDVYDFMSATLKPSSVRRLEDLKAGVPPESVS